MKAISYSEYGSPDVLELTEQPLPKVGPGMVLVKVKAASVNPVDWKIMAGYLDSMMDVQFPVVPGWDVAGVVESTGIDAPNFRPGDEVIAYGRKDLSTAAASPSTSPCRNVSWPGNRQAWTGTGPQAFRWPGSPRTRS
jgi:NADPH:quinone reductase-like Zn-dependent oxidoreductase